MAENHNDLSQSKDEVPIATAEDFRKDWEARGCPESSAVDRILETDTDAEKLFKHFVTNSRLLAESADFTASQAVLAMHEQSLAACFRSPEPLFPSTTLQAISSMALEDNVRILNSAKMVAATLADVDSVAIRASAAMAAKAIADYVSPPHFDPPSYVMQASLAKVWQDDALMGRYAETAFKLQIESLKSEEVSKTFEQTAAFQSAARILEEMSRAEAIYGFRAVEALRRNTPALDLELAALCGIGSSKATAAKSRPVQNWNRRDRTQPKVILSLETTTSTTTGNPSIVHEPSFSISYLFLVKLPPPVAVPEAEDETLRQMLTQGNAAAVVGHLRRQMGIRPMKKGRPASKRELYAQAAHLRERESLSWAQLARKMDPEGFRCDPAHCTLRFRKGVARFLKLHKTNADDRD